MTINTLAADLVMDRTTLGRNILPLERDGLITVEKGSRDRRSKELRLTKAGTARFRAATKDGRKRNGSSQQRSGPSAPSTCAPCFTPPPRLTSAPPAQAWRGNPRPRLVEGDW